MELLQPFYQKITLRLYDFKHILKAFPFHSKHIANCNAKDAKVWKTPIIYDPRTPYFWFLQFKWHQLHLYHGVTTNDPQYNHTVTATWPQFDCNMTASWLQYAQSMTAVFIRLCLSSTVIFNYVSQSADIANQGSRSRSTFLLVI